jgi:hypothetical protein
MQRISTVAHLRKHNARLSGQIELNVCGQRIQLAYDPDCGMYGYANLYQQSSLNGEP